MMVARQLLCHQRRSCRNIGATRQIFGLKLPENVAGLARSVCQQILTVKTKAGLPACRGCRSDRQGSLAVGNEPVGGVARRKLAHLRERWRVAMLGQRRSDKDASHLLRQLAPAADPQRMQSAILGKKVHALQQPWPARHQGSISFHKRGIERRGDNANVMPSSRERVSFAHQPGVVARMGRAHEADLQSRDHAVLPNIRKVSIRWFASGAHLVAKFLTAIRFVIENKLTRNCGVNIAGWYSVTQSSTIQKPAKVIVEK